MSAKSKIKGIKLQQALSFCLALDREQQIKIIQMLSQEVNKNGKVETVELSGISKNRG